MKRVLLAGLVVLMSAAFASAQVTSSKHDLRAAGGGTPAGTGLTEICAPCHTPHQATLPAEITQDPLWNHQFPAGTPVYGVYASTTLDATPAEIGAAVNSASASMLCMSCHDGSVSVVAMYNVPNTGAVTPASVGGRIDATGRIISNANMGTNLTNDHPINFTYDTALATADGALFDPASTPAVADLLYGGTVQCSSCHDVHKGTPENGVQFMVMSNSGSALCLTCHNK